MAIYRRKLKKAKDKVWRKETLPFLLPYLSFGLIALSVVRYDFGWISLFAVVPLFAYLDYANKMKFGYKNIIKNVGFAGFLGYASILSWSLQTSPDNWASVGGIVSKIFLAFTWLSLTACFAVGPLVFAWLVTKLKARVTTLKGVLVIALAWVAADIFRSLFFSIAAAGPGSLIGAYWNFGSLGYAASVTPLAFASRFVGLSGMTFLVILINGGMFLLLHKKLQGLILLIVPTLLAYGGYIAYPLQKDKKINVGVVQLGGWEGEGGYHKELAKRTAGNTNKPLDLLVLPEHSDFYGYLGQPSPDEDSRKQAIKNLFKDNNGLVVTTTSKLDNKAKTTNTIVYTDAKDNVLSEQDKHFIVPIGEYVPYVHEFLLTITGNRVTYDIHQQTRAVERGKQSEHPVEYNGVSYGALACSGAIAPEFYRKLSNQGAEVLTNSASLPILSNASQYHQQSRQMARFIAISNAKPFVQSARGGYSWVLDANGNFIYKTNHYNFDYFNIAMDTSTSNTLYTKL